MLFLIPALAAVAHGQEEKFEKYNFAITPPEGWESKAGQVTQPGLVAMYMKPGGGVLLFIGVDESSYKEPIVLNDEFVDGFNKGFDESNGGKFLSGKYVEVLGIKSYERQGVIAKNGASLSTFTRVIPVGAKAYALAAMSKEGDAGGLPEVQKCIASFRFLTPPAIPPPAVERPAAYTNEVATGKFPAFAAPAGVVVLLGLVILLISLRNSRRAPPGE